jgi:drug/metabolite transporter (DMT)-like permease
MYVMKLLSQLKYKPTPLNLFGVFLLFVGVYFLFFPGYYVGRIISVPLFLLAMLLVWLDFYSQRKIKKYHYLVLFEIVILLIILTIWMWTIY